MNISIRRAAGPLMVALVLVCLGAEFIHGSRALTWDYLERFDLAALAAWAVRSHT